MRGPGASQACSRVLIESPGLPVLSEPLIRNGTMSVDEILEDFFFVERGYLNGNHFVYRSASPVLIDTGYVADFADTKKAITGLGVRLSDVSLIVNTHTHCDHIGGNAAIQQQSGCDIALHRIGKHFTDTRDDWSTWWRYYNQEARFFQCTRSLEDGDVVSIGPHDFHVFHTPGHASDGIVLYDRREKILLSSDTLWENDVAVMTLRVEGSGALFQMQDSLEKIASLDVKRVYPGHGTPFENAPKAIEKSRKKIEAYLKDRTLIGRDLLKKILMYTLLMKKGMKEKDVFPYLMDTIWFPETVDFYFNADYKGIYSEIMSGLLQRGVVRRDQGTLFPEVRP